MRTSRVTDDESVTRTEAFERPAAEPDLGDASDHGDQDTGSPWGLTSPSRLLPLVAAVALLVAGVVVLTSRPGGGPGPGEALVNVDGVAIVSRAAGGTERITDRTKLLPGDRLVMERGTAELELNDDVAYTALGPAGSAEGTDLQMDLLPALRKGPLLVTAPRDTSLDTGSGTVTVTGGSVVRVARTIAARVDVFRGSGRLASAGAQRRVEALRSAEIVAAGDLSRPRPMTYDASDRWDRRYLGPALALDRQLAPLVAGLRASNADAAVLGRRVADRLGLRLTEAQVAEVIAGRDDALDAVIGSAITAVGGTSSFADRVADAFAFHDRGAPWGLVAMDQGADPDAVIDALTSAIDVAPLPVAAPGSRTGSAGQDTGSTDSGAVGADPTSAAIEGESPPVAGGGTDSDDGGQPGQTGPGTPEIPVGGGEIEVTVPPVGGSGGATVPGVTIPGVSVPGVSTGGGGVQVGGGGVGVTLPPVSTPVIGAGGTGVGVGSGGVIITPPSVSVPGVSVPTVTVPGVSTGSGGILGGGSLTVPVTVPPVGSLLGG